MKSMSKLFTSLKNHPEKDREIADLIKHTLNDEFSNIKCNRVFISHGNDYSPFVINVIPSLPKINILSINNITEYDIDIDLASFASASNYNGMADDELVAWLYHELLANVITDETLLRYKKLLIKYYDSNNSAIMDTIKTFGRLLWIGIFSRTRKDYIKDDEIVNGVNAMIQEAGLDDSWNTALAKYICLMGGDASIITDEYISRMDKTQLREFNTLARKYSAYVFKYNNTDYSTMIKYIISSTNSQLVKYYCEKEPDQMIVFKEKDVYNLFDDRRLLLEDSESPEIDPMLRNTITATELQNKFNEYSLDIDEVKTASDKIKLGAEIHDLIKQISDKILTADYDVSGLSLLKEKSNMLLDKLNKIDVDKTLSTIEIDGAQEF